MTVEHSEITCNTAPAAGRRYKWVVTIDGQLSREQTMSYEPPFIFSVTKSGGQLLRTDGGEKLRISGKNLGPDVSFLDSLTYGPFSNTYAVNETGCVLLESTQSSELLECTTAPGIGTMHSWQVVVEGQASEPSVATVGYLGPSDGDDSVELVTREGQKVGVWNTDAKDANGDPVMLFLQGNNFGLCDPRVSHKVQFKPNQTIPGATEISEELGIDLSLSKEDASASPSFTL